SSISKSTGYTPFELNYGTMPRIATTLDPDPVMPGVRQFAERALLNLAHAHDAIIESRVIQSHYANQRHRPDEAITPGDLVYLSTEN
ncbi:hypothetical protein GLOTRDRAFT_12161, partial [Gloeophyllum trabeum ATCC 11539]